MIRLLKLRKYHKIWVMGLEAATQLCGGAEVNEFVFPCFTIEWVILNNQLFSECVFKHNLKKEAIHILLGIWCSCDDLLMTGAESARIVYYLFRCCFYLFFFVAVCV